MLARVARVDYWTFEQVVALAAGPASLEETTLAAPRQPAAQPPAPAGCRLVAL